MSEARLARIEEKLDGLVGIVVDLKATTTDLTIGQASVEHRFERLETEFDAREHERFAVQDVIADLRAVSAMRSRMEQGFGEVLEQLDHRIRPLEDSSRAAMSRLDDHERRILALEQRRGA